MPQPVKANVAELTPSQVGVDPVGENTLSGCAKLARSAEYSAAINVARKVESECVFRSQRLGGKLGRAIQGDGAGGRKRGVNAVVRYAIRKRLRCIKNVAAVLSHHWQ